MFISLNSNSLTYYVLKLTWFSIRSFGEKQDKEKKEEKIKEFTSFYFVLRLLA
jgi:hypothetical protein